MMCGSLAVPVVQKSSCAERKTIPAVRISEFKDWARNGFSVGTQELQLSLRRLYDGKQCDRTVPHRHLNRQTATDFAMVKLQRPHLCLAFGDRNMSRAVVPHQKHILLIICGVIFCEGAADTKRIQDLHSLNILDFILPSNGYPATGQETGSEDDGTDHFLVLRVSNALIVV